MRDAVVRELALGFLQCCFVRDADQNDIRDTVEVVGRRGNGESGVVRLNHLMFEWGVLTDEKEDVPVAGGLG